MNYLIDTNTCIFIINGAPERARQHFEQIKNSRYAMSALTLYELDRGARKGTRVAENLLILERIRTVIPVADFNADAAQRAGELFQTLKQRGTPIGPIDTLIAGHALALDATLVTNNTKEFARVPGLQLEDWLS
jgi:tRNA(fMet)-specific endonuclease VapC